MVLLEAATMKCEPVPFDFREFKNISCLCCAEFDKSQICVYLSSSIQQKTTDESNKINNIKFLTIT